MSFGRLSGGYGHFGNAYGEADASSANQSAQAGSSNSGASGGGLNLGGGFWATVIEAGASLVKAVGNIQIAKKDDEAEVVGAPTDGPLHGGVSGAGKALALRQGRVVPIVGLQQGGGAGASSWSSGYLPWIVGGVVLGGAALAFTTPGRNLRKRVLGNPRRSRRAR